MAVSSHSCWLGKDLISRDQTPWQDTNASEQAAAKISTRPCRTQRLAVGVAHRTRTEAIPGTGCTLAPRRVDVPGSTQSNRCSCRRAPKLDLQPAKSSGLIRDPPHTHTRARLAATAHDTIQHKPRKRYSKLAAGRPPATRRSIAARPHTHHATTDRPHTHAANGATPCSNHGPAVSAPKALPARPSQTRRHDAGACLTHTRDAHASLVCGPAAKTGTPPKKHTQPLCATTPQPHHPPPTHSRRSYRVANTRSGTRGAARLALASLLHSPPNKAHLTTTDGSHVRPCSCSGPPPVNPVLKAACASTHLRASSTSTRHAPRQGLSEKLWKLHARGLSQPLALCHMPLLVVKMCAVAACTMKPPAGQQRPHTPRSSSKPHSLLAPLEMPQGQPAPHAVKSRLCVRSGDSHSTCSLCCKDKEQYQCSIQGKWLLHVWQAAAGVSPHERAPLGTQLWCGATPHTRCAHAAASQPDHRQASNQAQAWLETPCEPARKKGIPDTGTVHRRLCESTKQKELFKARGGAAAVGVSTYHCATRGLGLDQEQPKQAQH